jgi:hypothetical protein
VRVVATAGDCHPHAYDGGAVTIHYAREQAWKALYALAVGVEPIQDRCVNAMTAGLIHIDIDRDELSADQAQDLKKVMALLTAREPLADERSTDRYGQRYGR